MVVIRGAVYSQAGQQPQTCSGVLRQLLIAMYNIDRIKILYSISAGHQVPVCIVVRGECGG